MNRIVAASLTAAVVGANLHDRAHYEGKFFDWLQEHKPEIKNGADFVHMLQNFANNEDLIQETNAKNLTYKLGHNAYSHMSWEEFKAHFRLGLAAPQNGEPDFIHTAPADVSTLAATVDWVSAGAVTDVKNQGNCGSCWSFSATGALEGAYEIKYGSLQSFSEQQLVSCDNLDSGCNGGLMNFAFTWIKNNGGICSESGYPYTSGNTGKNGDCYTTCSEVANTNVKSFTNVQTNSDSALKSALNGRPVSVAIQANQPAFQLYKSGVLTGSCGTRLDHGVLAVGYGVDSASGLGYYNVKNSWGTSWGMNGYIWIQSDIGSSQPEGQCGILSGPPSYPNL